MQQPITAKTASLQSQLAKNCLLANLH